MSQHKAGFRGARALPKGGYSHGFANAQLVRFGCVTDTPRNHVSLTVKRTMVSPGARVDKLYSPHCAPTENNSLTARAACDSRAVARIMQSPPGLTTARKIG